VGIKLQIIEDGVSGTWAIRGCVAHLGLRIPDGKRGVNLSGTDISEHHGKIIYAYGAYHYVNLTERPTQVFRPAGFSCTLDPFMSQCQIEEGDRLQMGSATIEVDGLKPPAAENRARRRVSAESATCRYVDCGVCEGDTARRVVRLTSALPSRLYQYAVPHEILRAAVDWLETLYRDQTAELAHIDLGSPASIAVVPAPGATGPWEGFTRPIYCMVRSPEPGTQEQELPSLPLACLDSGRAFRYHARQGRLVGAAVGILEETCYREGRPAAGHGLCLICGPGDRPTAHDLCVLQHVATHVSSALGNLGPLRLRREREMMRTAGVESRGLFHDMLGIARRSRAYIEQVLALLLTDVDGAETAAQGAGQCVDSLSRYIEYGRDAFDSGQAFHYQLIDTADVCSRQLRRLYGEGPAVKQTRDWHVHVDHAEADGLKAVPADLFSVDRIAYNLCANAAEALNRRGTPPTRKRLHVFLDFVRCTGLRFTRLRFADDGCGLSVDARNSIFEGRFSTRSRGHGLGTQVVAEQVRRHCGMIHVASEVGTGTVVSILIPAPEEYAVSECAPYVWLEPYRSHAETERFVTREGLAELRSRDPLIAKWYQM
jgi:signal transduction histidine kinase